MDNLETICYNPHPSISESFDILYSELHKRVALGFINVATSDTGLELFNYTRQCSYDAAWDKYTLIARGLILDPKNKKIVAFCLPKFMNLGEISAHVPNLSFSVTEKMDGSAGFIWYANGKWNVSTRGSFNSEQSIWAEKWLYENVDVDSFIKGYTYIVEIIYKENRIVIKYEEEGLFLITVYDAAGYELSPIVYKVNGLGIVKHYNYSSIDELVKVCETMSSQEEGFVVRFENGYRLKIKSREYIRLHRIISNITPLAIWEALMNKDNMELIRKELPEEILKDYDTITGILVNKQRMLLENIVIACENTRSMTDKELGLFLQSKENPYPKDVSKFLFPCRKDDFLNKINEIGKHRQRFFDTFRPNGNMLEGYSQSNVMNRFSKEEDN